MNREDGGKGRWPRWHHLFDLLESPLLGALICMTIAPLYIFFSGVRMEMDRNGNEGGCSIFVCVCIGALLWSVGLTIGGLMLVDYLRALRS